MNKKFDNVYDVLIEYFDNPTFTKIRDNDNLLIYMCKINVRLIGNNRYLVCMVPRDVYFVGDTLKLSELKWIVFQTREMMSNFKFENVQSYTPKRNGVFNEIIHVEKRTSDEVKYISNENSVLSCLDISLLNNKANVFEYPEKGAFNSALETYNTILIFKIEKNKI